MRDQSGEWYENMSAIEATTRKLAAARAPKTICPSEVARAIQPEDWRSLMPAIREAAERLVAANQIVCTQRGEPTSPTHAKGPIRLALSPASNSTPLLDQSE